MKKFTLFFLLLFSIAVYSQDVINLGVNDKISDALSSYSGSNVILVIPAGYTNPHITSTSQTITIPALTAGARVTIKGDGTMPTLSLKSLSVPSTSGINYGLLKFQDLKITGYGTDPTVNYVVNVPSGTAFNADSLVFSGCQISTFRSLARFQSTNTTIDQKVGVALFDNCVIRNFADYGVIYNNKSGGQFGSVIAKKSTFYGFGQSIFLCQTNTGSINISDCTIDNSFNTSAKGLVDLSTQTSPVTITNCILGKTIAASGALSIKTAGTLTIANCYTTTDWLASAPTATAGITGTFTSYSGASTDLFTTTNTSTPGTAFVDGANYTIKDATFAGKTSAGDPRWYYTGTTGINQVRTNGLDPNGLTNVYGIDGKVIKSNVVRSNAKSGLQKGIYVIDQKKILVKD